MYLDYGIGILIIVYGILIVLLRSIYYRSGSEYNYRLMVISETKNGDYILDQIDTCR